METYEIIYKDGRKCTFAVLPADVKFALMNIEPNPHSIGGMATMRIRMTLKIGVLEDAELTYLRNAVVRMFSDVLDYEREASRSKTLSEDEVKVHDKNYDDAMSRMSIITTIIDEERWQRGLI